METRANYVIVGSVVLASLVALALFIAWLARSQFDQSTDTYYTYFTGSVAGLSNGSTVRYRGVPVGTVAKIEIDPENIEKIRVILKLNEGTPIRTDSVAALEIAGITGGSFVEITGGTHSSQPLKAPDGQIPVIPSQNSGLASLEENAPKLLSKLLEVTDRLDAALSPDSTQAISQTLINLRSVSTDLAALTPHAREATENLNQLLANLRSEVPKLMTALQQDAVSAREAADQIRAVANGVNAIVAENRGPLRDFTGNGLTQMTSLLSQLRGLSETFQRVANKLDRDPQRYLFGGGASQGVDPSHPISIGASSKGAQ